MALELFTNITLQSIVVFVAGILSFIAGALIYSRDIRRIDNLSFFLLAWSFSMWELFLGVFESVAQGSFEFFLLKILYVFASVIPPAVLFFAMTLSPGGRVVLTRIKVFFIAIPFILISLMIFIPGFLLDSVKNNGTAAKEIIFGYGFPVFVLYISLYVIAGVILLFAKYKKSAGVFRKEIRYIFSIILAGALFILFANLILPYFGSFDFFWIGPVAGTIILWIIGYLIIKYNFWNLKLAATDLFTSLISLILIFELIASVSMVDFLVKMAILILVLLSGVFLVRSVRREIKNKEEVEKLVKQLASVNDSLHELNKQKTEFVATAAHHLRDPLTAINGYTAMILDGSFGKISKQARNAVDRIFESGKRLVVIVEDFMDISKIESGDMDYDFSDADIENIIKELVDEMSISAKKNGLDMKLNIEKNNNYISRVDSGKFRQVVSNLIDNAIKYTPHGSVSVSLAKNNGKILIKIADTGIGMSKTTLKKIFHKFSRADEASKFHTGGSGLGLYVAKEMLKKHEGRIWAESEGLGKGSTFFVELNA